VNVFVRKHEISPASKSQAVQVERLNNSDFCEKARRDGKNKIYRVGTCEDCGEEYGYVIVTIFGDVGIPIPQYCKCDREGYDEFKAEEEKRKFLEKVYRLQKNSGFNPEQENMVFGTYIPTCPSGEKALKYARHYVDTFAELKQKGLGLLFSGNTGGGKTHLCSAIGNALIAQGIGVKFVQCSRLFRRLRSTQSSFDESIEDVIRPYERVTLLILDELSTDKTTPFENEQLETLIEYRVGNRLPTLITTNSTVDELLSDKSPIDKRITSRILDKRKFAQITLAAPDYRRRGNV
jgi:DNA replication protein DnaC